MIATDEGVVTLGGHVFGRRRQEQAESMAKIEAGAQVVADQIVVTPPGAESESKTVNSDLDAGITKNLHAALLRNRLDKSVNFDVRSGVVTLSGDVS
jgi:osmotically-inducible protein OsmY